MTRAYPWIIGPMTRTCAGAMTLLAVSCGPQVLIPTDGQSSESASESGDPPPPNGTSTTTVDPSTTTTGEDGPTESTDGDDDAGGFIPPNDDGSSSYECDIFAQDCPPGEKCMPWANDGGGAWNAWGCFPIDDDPGDPGEPCTVVGSGVSGMDSCTVGAMCWNVDPETNEGTCIALCTGSYANPYCEDPDTACAVSSELALCLPICDPVAQDCPEGQGCYPVGEDFWCAPATDTSPAGEPCEFINTCEPGSFCASADVVPDCEEFPGCCSPFCMLGDPMPPCLPGQACQPWYDRGEGPAPLDHVGGCGLPR